MQRIISQLIVLLFAVSGVQFAQGASDRAYAVANSNAHFLRCGTKHPTAAEARELEERFQSWKQANAKKPTSNPGNGNGNGGGGGDGSGSGSGSGSTSNTLKSLLKKSFFDGSFDFNNSLIILSILKISPLNL